jgi:ATP-dependent DNA ligase
MRLGSAVFELLRRKRQGAHVFLYDFNLIELDGTGLRREPLETGKATLAACCAAARPAYA